MSNIVEFPDNNDVVILELDKPRELRFGHKAMKRYSAITGTSMSGIQSDMDRYDRLTLMLYVMLYEDDKDLTPEAVDDLIDQAERRKENRLHLSDIIQSVVSAFSAAVGPAEDQEEEQEEDPPPAAGTGEEV